MIETPPSQQQGDPRRTVVAWSTASARHHDPHHPENQTRLEVVGRYLQENGLLERRILASVREAPLNDVERVHSPWYVERLDRLATGGGAWLDRDTYVGEASYDVALMAAGAALAAVDAVLEGAHPTGFALARPPGHHATADRGMGFCLFNNVAIAAAHALHAGVERVAIVDWDVHHGNGTQDIFYDSDKVLFLSVHQHPFYPGTGGVQERGEGPGHGLNRNFPLLAGQGDHVYLDLFDTEIAPALRAFRPDLLLISAGYDAHLDDPLGGMRVSDAGFAAMTQRLLEVAEESDSGLVAVLEGGYDPPALARSVAATLTILDGDSWEDSGGLSTDPAGARTEQFDSTQDNRS